MVDEPLWVLPRDLDDAYGEAAVAKGTALAKERGFHHHTVVIPNPDARTVDLLLEPITPFSDFLV